MKLFFDRMRAGDPRFIDVFDFSGEIAHRYTFNDFTVAETTALWAMQPYDAKMLFVLSQTGQGSLSKDITGAMYMAVYEEIERFFYLNSFHHNSFAVLPANEYVRLLEILKRMNWVNDPFLKATNLMYQGIVKLNLGLKQEGLDHILDSRQSLSEVLAKASEKLSKKRILRSRAATNVILGELLKAESDYFAILKIDPEDWTALLDLSYLLNRRGECSERGLWIEALVHNNQDQFDIVIHCGNQEYPEESFPTEPPAIAFLNFTSVR